MNTETQTRRAPHANAKLTVPDVLAIRAAAARGVAYATLARTYGITPVHVRLIVLRRAWEWLAEQGRV